MNFLSRARAATSTRMSVKQTLAKTLVLAGEARRAQMILLVVLALLASGLEFIGAALMLIVLTLVGDESNAVALPFLGDISSYLPGTGRESTVWAAAALGGFFIVRGFVVIGQIYIQLRVLHNAGARLAASLLRGYVRTPYLLHLRRDSSEIIRNVDQARKLFVTSVLMPYITLATQAFMVTALLAFLVATAWEATILVLAATAPVIVLLLRVVQPRLKALGTISHTETARSIALVQETMAGIREIKLHRKESYFVDAFAASTAKIARTLYLMGAAVQLPRLIIETMLVLAMLALVVVSALSPSRASGTISMVGLFAYVSFRLQPALQQIVAALNNIRYASPVVDKLYADYTTSDHSPLRVAAASSGLDGLCEVRVRAVTFSYDDDDRYALRQVDLRVRKGESIGICGPTGSGKSTLVDVICGLLEPVEGTVECNGDDIRNDIGGWYARVGLVSQSAYLFPGTIRDNIALGLPRVAIDENRVEEAARLAQLAPMLEELPDGLDSEIGERGVRLSGGQRQRIAIACALYLRPELLVFDEGTSALDNITEAALIEAIDELRGERTIVTVAHRLSTVRRCDRIVYLNHGSVEAEGTYDELVAHHAAFTAMSTFRA